MKTPLALTVCSLLVVSCAGLATRGERSEGERGPKMHPRGTVVRWSHRVGPDGRLPDGVFGRAKRQRDAVAATTRSALLDGGASNGAPVGWTWRGPGNVGGRLRAILIDPDDANRMWVGSVGGGIWHSTDGGASWQPQDSFLPVLAVACMAMDPNDADVLYAGTGEGGFFDTPQGSSNLAVPNGEGIFMTTDGGQLWTQLPSTTGWRSVSRIAVDPVSGTTLLAATENGIYRSIDGGTTWSQRTTALALDVDFHPTNPSLAVAGTGINPGSQALYSTDGGATWQAASGTGTSIRVETAYARSNPNTVYAAVTRNGRLVVYRSTDGGQSYTQMSSSSQVTTYSRYNSALWVDPTNENRLLVGGVSTYRSLNAGQSLSDITGSLHLDVHLFVEHPDYDGSANRTVFAGTDGGIARNTAWTVSSSWPDLNNNLGVTQFYGGTINPISGVIMAGAQDNGTVRWGGGSPDSWISTFGGDGGHAEADPTDPNVFYGSYQNLGVFRSTNGGLSASSFITQSGPRPIQENSPNFIAPFELDPNAPTVMYAAGAGLWRSNNVKTGTPRWVLVKSSIGPVCNTEAPGAAGPSHFAADPPCNISAIDIAVGDSNTVWVGHNSGQVFKSTNALGEPATWTQVDSGWPLPDRQVSKIAIDPNDHNRVYVSFQGYQSDNLWKTDDAGNSWTLITGSGGAALPSAPVTSVAVHPVLPGCLYAGTDLGMFWSADDGQTWATSSAGTGATPIDEFEWRDSRTLLVVTHGRGVWEVDVGAAASAASVGTGCGIGGPPVLTVTPPQVGASQSYGLAGAAGTSPVFLMYGAGVAAPLPIGGCTFLVSQPALSFPVGTTDSGGAWTFQVAIPADKAFLGSVLTTQAVIAVAGGPFFGVAELSNGQTMTVGL